MRRIDVRSRVRFRGKKARIHTKPGVAGTKKSHTEAQGHREEPAVVVIGNCDEAEGVKEKRGKPARMMPNVPAMSVVTAGRKKRQG